LFYWLSYFLDAFDGYAARLLDQGTKFGALLDMVTDRFATCDDSNQRTVSRASMSGLSRSCTSGILAVLTHVYPSYAGESPARIAGARAHVSTMLVRTFDDDAKFSSRSEAS
jgi:hypothetical protein